MCKSRAASVSAGKDSLGSVSGSSTIAGVGQAENVVQTQQKEHPEGRGKEEMRSWEARPTCMETWARARESVPLPPAPVGPQAWVRGVL